MWESLQLVHRQGTEPFQVIGGLEAEGDASSNWISWKTCLRQIVVGYSDIDGDSDFPYELSPSDQIHQGEAAYRFLLEIICGLHSRVLGENEILAQFKARFLSEMDPSFTWSAELKRLSQSLLADAKKVRTLHHLNQGSHSYGSFARKALGSHRRVSIIGTGELARAVLPWLLEVRSLEVRNEVQVFYRSEEGRDALRQALCSADLSRVRFVPLFGEDAEVSLEGGLIIAAPIAAAAVENLIAISSHSPEVVIDYRAEAKTDPVHSEIPVTVGLEEFFQQMESISYAGQTEKARALKTILTLCEARAVTSSIQIRTQGWEDLCG